MNCSDIQKLIPFFLDRQLKDSELEAVSKHLAQCDGCQKELKAYQQSWHMLEEWPAIEPEPNYVSRFWTKLAEWKPWYERYLENIKLAGRRKQWAYAVSMVCIILVVFLTVSNTTRNLRTEQFVVLSDQPETEMVAQIELAENFDIIEELDFLEDFEVIEQLDYL